MPPGEKQFAAYVSSIGCASNTLELKLDAGSVGEGRL